MWINDEEDFLQAIQDELYLYLVPEKYNYVLKVV